MGSSPPTIVQTPAPAPKFFKSVVPLESYQMMADVMRRTQEETNKLKEQRYSEVGTPAELGARAAGRRAQEAASYLSSIPFGDKYLRETRGAVGQYKPAREAAAENLTDAQQAYAEAMSKIDERPTPTPFEMPMWAKSTIAEGMPAAKEDPSKIAELTQRLSNLEKKQAAKPNPFFYNPIRRSW